MVPSPLDPTEHVARLQRHLAAVHALARLDHERLEDAISTAVREVAVALDVARVSVWVYEKDRTAIRCRGVHDPLAPASAPRVLRGATHPRYFAALREQRLIAASDAQDDPRTSEFRDDYLVPLRITAMLDVALLVGGEAMGVLCAEHRGGPRAWVEAELALMRSAASILSIGFAIERQRSLEEQLRQSQKMEAVGLLAGGLAHDVNNLLNVVQGEAELLEDGLESDELRERAAAIRAAARRGAGLTQKLLTFAHQRPIALEPVDLCAVVDGAEPLMRRALDDAVRLRLRRPEHRLMVLGDPALIEQVLLNLVVNAGQAMPKGGTLTVELSLMSGGPGAAAATAAPRARIEVSDTGTGIARELLDRVWEPFFTTREFGSGLGLAIVHGAVRQMGGTVAVESETGKGTTFRLLLPVHGAALVQSPPVVTSSEPTAAHLLLAEDEPDVRRVLSATLRRAGYRVTEAEDGEEAAALFAREPSAYQLFVSDVMMPRLDGPGAFERMQEVRPGLNVLFLSGFAPEAHRLAGLARGGSRAMQLAKPVPRRELLAAVSGLLTG